MKKILHYIINTILVFAVFNALMFITIESTRASDEAAIIFSISMTIIIIFIYKKINVSNKK